MFCLEKSNENAMDVYVCLGYENAWGENII
jgi:hypothetical protein